jgi:large subunit ribosomal protein L31
LLHKILYERRARKSNGFARLDRGKQRDPVFGQGQVASPARFGYKARAFLESAMKKSIHPDYHEITVLMTDGTSYKTRSTYGKAGDTLHLEVDSKSHPAWTGGQQRLTDSGQLARFNKRFQGIGLKK